MGQNLAVFRTADPLIVNLKAPNPKRHVYQSEHDFWAIKRAIRTKIATSGLAEETEKKHKKVDEESHKTVIFHLPRGGAISQPIFTKFDEFVDLTDVITPAKFCYKIFIDFSTPRGWKSHFPHRKRMAYITGPCATALAGDNQLS